MSSARALVTLGSLLGSLTGPARGQGRDWMFGPFEKPPLVNPAIAPNGAATFFSPINDGSVRWEEYATFNPAAVVKDGKVYVLYRAEDATGGTEIGRHTSRIGLAESADGLRFTRRSAPVLYPDKDEQTTFEWPGGVEDPRIVEAVDWTPLADSAGRLVKVLTPRRGYFDAWLVEAGPPAIITPHGILLMYNAGNSGQYGDPTLPDRIYTGGQALYDGRNPLRLIARSDQPFIRPTEDYERTGQYTAGTTFVEGLVPFHGRWYLYYGTADSRVGVAVWDPN